MNHPGFLKAICEEPDDDAHRLIYADWLDDHGEEGRAEFIRLQCALAKLDDEDEAMKAREAKLLGRHREAWLAELPALPKVTWGDRFRRGFVERASLPSYGSWRRQGLALLEATPFETVCIHQVTPITVRRLGRSPGIERVRGLEFPTGGFGDDDLEVLGKGCRPRAFSYRNTVRSAAVNLSPDAGRVLGTSPGFIGLRWLLLDGVPLGNGSAAHLASAPNLAELESLLLMRCGLTAVSVGALTGHASWVRLRSLLLMDGYISDEGARKIASCPGMNGLHDLRLPDCNLGPAGATAIARSMFLTNLRRLDLSSSPIGSDGVAALATSSNLRRLRVLDLGRTRITGKDIVALLRSPLGMGLRQLNVYGNPLDAKSAAAIVATPGLENLRWLSVSRGEGHDLLIRRLGERILIV